MKDVNMKAERQVNFQIVAGTRHQAEEIFEVKAAAVSALCARDYDQDQIARWVAKGSRRELEAKIASDPTYVAMRGARVVGYCQVSVQSGEVLAVYVLPSCARQGVGAALLTAAELHAQASGQVELWVDASITAEPFYAHHGYQRQHSASFPLGAEVELPCIRMTKRLAEPRE